MIRSCSFTRAGRRTSGVTINLYQVGTAADGVTPTLKLVDTTKTELGRLAQGFRSDAIRT